MEEKFTTSNAAIKNGLILGLISILIATVNNMFALYENRAIGIVIMIVSIALMIYFIVASHNLFKANNGGFMSYGQGLGIGVMVAAISSIISAVFSFIYISYIDDASILYQRQQSIDQLAERGMDQAQIDQAAAMTETFTGPTAILVIGILMGIFFGFIFSLIISAITKNSDPSLDL